MPPGVFKATSHRWWPYYCTRGAARFPESARIKVCWTWFGQGCFCQQKLRKEKYAGEAVRYGMLKNFRISGIGQLQARLNLRVFHRPMKNAVYYMPKSKSLLAAGAWSLTRMVSTKRGNIRKGACAPLKSRASASLRSLWDYRP